MPEDNPGPYHLTPAESRSVQHAFRELDKWQTLLQHLLVLMIDQHQLKGPYDFAPGGTILIPIPRPPALSAPPPGPNDAGLKMVVTQEPIREESGQN